MLLAKTAARRWTGVMKVAEYIEREVAIRCCTCGITSLGWIGELRRLPAADVVEVRYGRWIIVSSFDAFGGDEEAWMAHGNPTALHYCSECKNEAYANEEGKEILSNYCPNCGAKMDTD